MTVLDDHLTGAQTRTLSDDVLDGLTRPFKELPPKHFYDARGSELFEQICAQPEYYPTRTELEILREHGAALMGDAADLVELGSGAATKARLLLDAGVATRYVPIDVSRSALEGAAAELERPGLEVRPVVGDFERHLDRLPEPIGPRAFAFLGGTIGNFPPGSRRRFLRGLAASMRPGDRLLLGTGLVTDPAVLHAAYNDAAGVTAEFNRNVLRVVNRELDADFDVEAFEHVAFYDRRREWIEMRLRAVEPQRVHVRALGLHVDLGHREEIRTEISAKFTRERLAADLAAAGLALQHVHTDPAGLFAVSVSGPAPVPA